MLDKLHDDTPQGVDVTRETRFEARVTSGWVECSLVYTDDTGKAKVTMPTPLRGVLVQAMLTMESLNKSKNQKLSRRETLLHPCLIGTNSD